LKIDKLLSENMSENGLKIWLWLFKKIPNIWDKPVSSSGKYHLKEDGHVPTIGEHTEEMLYTCIKLFSMFDIKPKTEDADILILGVLLHDSFKYGIENPISAKHTNSKHDKIIADKIAFNRKIFSNVFGSDKTILLEDIVRHHMGRWGTDVEKNFKFEGKDLRVFFIHVLDMLSSRNLLKYDSSIKEEEKK